MIATAARRRAAIALSVMAPRARRRLLDSLPNPDRQSLLAMLAHIERRGWNDRRAVALALGDRWLELPDAGSFSTQELVALAQRLTPATYARLIAACRLGDSHFLFSLLEQNYAHRVRQDLAHVPTLPERLAASLLATVRRMLLDGKAAPCAD